MLQVIFLDEWHFCMWEAICNWLVVSFVLFIANAKGTHTRCRDMESVSEEIRHDGPVLAFIELVEDARVFENCKSWKKKYQAKKNDVFVPLCTPKEYNGYDMVPVLGGGAIQADLARPCPAVVAASSFVTGGCVQHISHATDFNTK